MPPMADTKLQDANRFRLLKLIHERPDITQREIASELGLSLGKVNYCVKALIGVGYVKAGNFSRSKYKLGYTYLLTPKGLAEKSAVTVRFLARKIAEYDLLEREIEEIRKDMEGISKA
jgi:MarR family transcriptional regulator, temperature-dependent positive regulator of motility